MTTVEHVAALAKIEDQAAHIVALEKLLAMALEAIIETGAFVEQSRPSLTQEEFDLLWAATH